MISDEMPVNAVTDCFLAHHFYDPSHHFFPSQAYKSSSDSVVLTSDGALGIQCYYHQHRLEIHRAGLKVKLAGVRARVAMASRTQEQ